MQLVVARIGRAHGIKGEVTVEVRTDEPELRLGPGAVLHTDPASVGPLTIETGRVHSGRLLLRFEGVKDRNAAEALRNTLLIADVDPDELPEEEDEYYDHQLVDLDVVLADGTEIGVISEISHLPSQDLLIVERPDGTELMVPFVSQIVTEIDLENQRAVIAPPPGLIDDTQAVVASARDAEAEAEAGAGAGAGEAKAELASPEAEPAASEVEASEPAASQPADGEGDAQKDAS
ncbi:ribosome maturation factor RimM [Streptomyces sp. NPDC126499]|uniref:ribosome maturation factor RimM n=1 Tax=Streptomyces sp. NPDC126499 TaxID=3155314 RepID=UPI00331FD23B